MEDLKNIRHSCFGKKYMEEQEMDWDELIKECDLNGDGVICF